MPVTLDDLLTLPLHKRIEWLRKREGSHDKLASRLGTTRQTVIGWEKGRQPNANYRVGLAIVSGFPADAFKRSAAECLQAALSQSPHLDRVVEETARGFEALGHQQHGLGGQEEDQEPQG